jgi:hypothetical protein
MFLDLGIRLQLLAGGVVPLPAPPEVLDALLSVQVRNQDGDRDGFQLRFSLHKDAGVEYALLRSGLFTPPNRVVLTVFTGVLPTVLIDGVVTQQQVVAGNLPGESALVVTGEDLSLMLDLEEKTDTFPAQPDSMIVFRLLGPYLRYGIAPGVTPTASVPLPTSQIPSRQETDLACIKRLAERNGFVFFIKPTVPGSSLAYWGPPPRLGLPQSALTIDMGPATNVSGPVTMGYNALGPAAPEVSVTVPGTGVTLKVPVPPAGLPPLAAQPAPSLRKSLDRDAGRLSPGDAVQQARAEVIKSFDAVTVTGELDVARYGQPLMARQLVGLRGVGLLYGGLYYVRQVTHNLEPGKYTQSFTLVREGLGTTTPGVVP